MALKTSDKFAFYESLRAQVGNIDWYESIVQMFIRECLLADGALSSIYPPQDGVAVYSEWDDLVPTLLLFGEYDFLLDQLPVSQAYLRAGLPVKQGGMLYSWRVDEFLGGLVEMNEYRRNGAITGQIVCSIDGVKSKFLDSSGMILGIYDPVDSYSPLMSYSRAGGLVEVMLDLGDYDRDVVRSARSALDWWIDNPFFAKFGVFPCKWFRRRDPRTLWARSEWLLPKPDYPFQTSGKSYIERGRLRDYRYLLWIPSIVVQVMKDNSNLVFAFIEGWKLTGDNRYAKAITRWCESVVQKMRIGPYIGSTWTPKHGASNPTLSQNSTFMDVLCDTFGFVERRSVFLDIACELAQAWVDLRWKNDLVPSTPGGSVAMLDEQTDFSVSLVKLSELTGDSKWREIAVDNIARAQQAFATPRGLVISIALDGNHVDKRVATKYNLLFAKGLVATKTPSAIYENPFLHSFLKDR